MEARRVEVSVVSVMVFLTEQRSSCTGWQSCFSSEGYCLLYMINLRISSQKVLRSVETKITPYCNVVKVVSLLGFLPGSVMVK